MSPEIIEALVTVAKIIAAGLGTAVVPTLLSIAHRLGALLIEQRKANETLEKFMILSNDRHEQLTTWKSSMETRMAILEAKIT